MIDSPHSNPIRSTIIRASAGTGKTQQLATRYLQLLNAGVDPRNILAVTFTRKAAGEILDRVIDRLVQAALDAYELSRLASDLKQPAFDRARCLKLITSLTERIHLVNVGTLDRYFYQKLLSGSGKAPRISNRRIADEADIGILQTDTIAALLHDPTADLSPLIRALTGGDASRRIFALVQDVVAAVYQLFLESARTGPEAWAPTVPNGRLDEAAFAAALQQLQQLPIPPGQICTARDNAVADLQNKDWEEFFKSGLAPKILNNEPYNRKAIPPEVRAAYRPLIAHASACIAAATADYTRAAFEMLRSFDREYELMKERKQLATFDDLPRYLTGTTGNDASADAFWDDPTIDHLLLDEFQDTSLAQWRALEAMARRTSSGKNTSLLCVGDAKQSIYGWRGGVPELLTSLPTLIASAAPEDLVKSFRSSPVIIDVVNQIFGQVPRLSGNDDYLQAIRDWWGNFKEHTTERDYDGHVTLQTAKEATRDALVAKACDIVEDIQRRQPDAEIAVLVVKNDEVADTIYQLRQRGIDASEEGGQSLTDSAAVRLLLSMLRLADHPGNSVARFHLEHSPLAQWISSGSSSSQFHAPMDSATREWRRRLFYDGLRPTLEAWSHPLYRSCSDAEWRRVQQLIQLAETWDSRGWTSLTEFVRFVEQERVGHPVASLIRVMTVHRAKGLQFDAVVFFGLDGRFIPRTPSYAYDRDPVTLDVNQVLKYVGKDLLPRLPPGWQSVIQQTKQRLVKERLCVLYVGVTRAIHALHMVICPIPNQNSMDGLASLVLAALLPNQTANADKVVWQAGTADWRRARGAAASESTKPTTRASSAVALSDSQPQVPLTPWPRRASRPATFQSPSTLEGNAKVSVAVLFQKKRHDAVQIGSQIHAILQHIHWLADGDDRLCQLNQAMAKAGINPTQHPEVLTHTATWLQSDAAQQLLDRERYLLILPRDLRQRMESCSFQLQVRTEQSVVVNYQSDDNTVGAGVVDRLVLGIDDGKPKWVHIIDYKTDGISSDKELASRTEFYRPQILAYRDLIVRSLNVPVDLPRADLCFLAAGKLIRIQ